jgi:hypothetical protein
MESVIEIEPRRRLIGPKSIPEGLDGHQHLRDSLRHRGASFKNVHRQVHISLPHAAVGTRPLGDAVDVQTVSYAGREGMGRQLSHGLKP